MVCRLWVQRAGSGTIVSLPAFVSGIYRTSLLTINSKCDEARPRVTSCPFQEVSTRAQQPPSCIACAGSSCRLSRLEMRK